MILLLAKKIERPQDLCQGGARISSVDIMKRGKLTSLHNSR
ncbi:unnamed protein product [Musa acuminata var. zebrina]